jgi:hypothetical protein
MRPCTEHAQRSAIDRAPGWLPGLDAPGPAASGVITKFWARWRTITGACRLINWATGANASNEERPLLRTAGPRDADLVGAAVVRDGGGSATTAGERDAAGAAPPTAYVPLGAAELGAFGRCAADLHVVAAPPVGFVAGVRQATGIAAWVLDADEWGVGFFQQRATHGTDAASPSAL